MERIPGDKMNFKSFMNEDVNSQRVSNLKKIQWLLKKIETEPKMIDMADRIIFDLDKIQKGFIRVKSKADQIQSKYPDLQGSPEDAEKRIGKDAYKLQYDRRRQELIVDQISTLKMNLANSIFFINKIKDQQLMDEVTKNISYFIKGVW
jgi:hypothetical protein